MIEPTQYDGEAAQAYHNLDKETKDITVDSGVYMDDDELEEYFMLNQISEEDDQPPNQAERMVVTKAEGALKTSSADNSKLDQVKAD